MLLISQMIQLYNELVGILFSTHSLTLKELYIKESYRNYLTLTNKEKLKFNKQFFYCINQLLLDEEYEILALLYNIGYFNEIDKQFLTYSI